jgi:hypothetical protein
LLRAALPVNPTDALPELFLDGKRAQVDGLVKNANGAWDVVLLSGLVNSGSDGKMYEVTETGSEHGFAPATDTTSLTGLRLEMKVANVAETFECDFMGFAAPDTMYSGSMLNVKRYWAPFVRTSGGSEQIGMVIALVTRRADVVGAELDFLICNGKHDITDTPFDTQDALDGDFHFDYIRLINLSGVGDNTWVGKTLVDRPHTLMQDSVTPWLVKPFTDPLEQEVIGPAQGFIRRCVIGPAAESEHLQSIAEWKDRGTAYGPNSYWFMERFGATKYKFPFPSEDFNYFGTTGKAGLDQLASEALAGTVSARAAGTSAPHTAFSTVERGWQHPTLDQSGGAGSAGGMEVFSGWHQTRAAYLLYSIGMEARVERDNCFAYSITDGEPGDVHRWSANNSSSHVAWDASTPGAANKMPWDASQALGVYEQDNPLFVHYKPFNSSTLDKNRALWPNVDDAGQLATRPWMLPDTGHTVPYRNAAQQQYANHFSNPPYYRHFKGTHMIRAWSDARSLYWSTGDSMAKEVIRAVEGYYTGPNPYGVQGFTGGTRASATQENLIDMPADNTFLDGDDGKDNMAALYWYRQNGWRLMLSACRYAIETDAYRTTDLTRWEDLQDLWERNVTPAGVVGSNNPPSYVFDSGNPIWREDANTTPGGGHQNPTGASNYEFSIGALPDGRDEYPFGAFTTVDHGSESLTFVASTPAKIQRTTGSFVTDGYLDDQLTMIEIDAGPNAGKYVIETTTALELTLRTGHTLTAEGPVARNHTQWWTGWGVCKTYFHLVMMNGAVAFAKAVFAEGADATRYNNIGTTIDNYYTNLWLSQPVAASSAPIQYYPASLHDPDFNPHVGAHATYKGWGQSGGGGQGCFLGTENLWTSAGPAHQIAFGEGVAIIERDMMQQGIFDTGAGLGSQDLTVYINFLWTRLNNAAWNNSMSAAHGNVNSNMFNSVANLAAAQASEGLQQIWHDAYVAAAPSE